MLITHIVMFKLLKGATEVGASSFQVAWVRNCNVVISDGEPR